MDNEIESGATPAEATPTVTVATPQGATQGATPNISADTAAVIANLTQERDAANARIRELNKENQKHRTGVESATAALETEKARIESLLKLGKPEEIEAAVQERDALKAEKIETQAKAERAAILKEVATAARVANPEVLVALDRPGLTFEVKPDPKNPKESSVTVKEGEAPAKPFDEFFAPFLPSLRPPIVPKYGASPAPIPGQNPQGTQILSRPRIL